MLVSSSEMANVIGRPRCDLCNHHIELWETHYYVDLDNRVSYVAHQRCFNQFMAEPGQNSPDLNRNLPPLPEGV